VDSGVPESGLELTTIFESFTDSGPLTLGAGSGSGLICVIPCLSAFGSLYFPSVAAGGYDEIDLEYSIDQSLGFTLDGGTFMLVRLRPVLKTSRPRELRVSVLTVVAFTILPYTWWTFQSVKSPSLPRETYFSSGFAASSCLHSFSHIFGEYLDDDQFTGSSRYRPSVPAPRCSKFVLTRWSAALFALFGKGCAGFDFALKSGLDTLDPQSK